MNFHTVKVWLSKLISNLVLMLFIILVPAVASGAVPFWAAVILWLAAAAIVGLNAACGVLLENQSNARPKAAPTPAHPAPAATFSALCGAAAPPRSLRTPIRCDPGAYNCGNPRVASRRAGIVVFHNLMLQ